MAQSIVFDSIVLAALLAGIAYFSLKASSTTSLERRIPDVPRYLATIRPSKDGEVFMKAAEIALSEFFKKSERSFSSCDMSLYEGMVADAAVFGKNAMDVVERMPNDAVAERDARSAIRNVDKILNAHMDDMRTRCRLPVIRKKEFYLRAGNDDA